jgi:CRISPR-associated endonuclease/helicase Cas3
VPTTLDGRPPDDAQPPSARLRCRVPLGELTKLMQRDVAIWRMDQVLGRWTRVSQSARPRPGEVLLVAAKDGGYNRETGFDPSARGVVPESPQLDGAPEPASGAEDAFRDDSESVYQRDWLSLDQHSADVRAQAERLLAVLQPDVPDEVPGSVVVAAYAHDAGKAHPIWQDALCRLAPDDKAAEIANGRPWAKSGCTGRLNFEGGVKFRHELASLLLLDGPLNALLSAVEDPDLTRYLVLAHHGKLRIQVREPGEAGQGALLGFRHNAVADVSAMLGQPSGELKVDLEQFDLGGERSWTRTVLGLRDRYGPFVLAYLETVVRIADWRASAGMEVAE